MQFFVLTTSTTGSC